MDKFYFNGQPVITSSMLAQMYGVALSTLHHKLKSYADYFGEGNEYFVLTGPETKNYVYRNNLPANITKLYLWTVTGAELLADFIGTDEAYAGFEYLDENYFTDRSASDEDDEFNEFDPVFPDEDGEANNGSGEDEYSEDDGDLFDMLTEHIESSRNDIITESQLHNLFMVITNAVINICGGTDTPAYRVAGKIIFDYLIDDILDSYEINALADMKCDEYYQALEYAAEYQFLAEIDCIVKEAVRSAGR